STTREPSSSALLSRSSLLFFTHPSPTAIYTLSLHDALPILPPIAVSGPVRQALARLKRKLPPAYLRRQLLSDRGAYRPSIKSLRDRKSTRLNSSHEWISYAVFCLKKKNYDNNMTSCIH